MADLLIRNVSDDDIKAIDALADRMGISRSELLRRRPGTSPAGVLGR